MPVETNLFFNGYSRIMINGPGNDVTSAVLPGLTWTSTMPGGHGQASFRLPATAPWGPYNASVFKGAVVFIDDGAGWTHFAGEVTNDCTHAIIPLTNEKPYYQINAAGRWWRAKQKKDFGVLFSSLNPDDWFVSPTLYKNISADTDGRLYLECVGDGTTYKSGRTGSIYYWLHEGMGYYNHEIQYFAAKLNYDVENPDWYWDLSVSDSPWSPWTVVRSWNNSANDSGFLVTDLPGFARALRVRLYRSSTGAVTTDRWCKLSNLALIGATANMALYFPNSTMTASNPTTITTKNSSNVSVAHDLVTGDRVALMRGGGAVGPAGWYTVTVTGTYTFTVPVLGTTAETVRVLRAPRVSDAMRAIAGGDSQVTSYLGTPSGVEKLGYVHYGLNFPPHTTRADAIDQCASLYEAPINYGFWGTSNTFQCESRPTTPAAAIDFLIDSKLPGISYNVYKDVEESPTYIKVLFGFRDTDSGTSSTPEGTVQAVMRPNPPTWTDAQKVIEVWDEFQNTVMTEADAIKLADNILAWIDKNQYVGTIILAVPTIPKRGGGTLATKYIQAGNWIEDSNYPTGRLMITSVSYDVDKGIATLQIGETRKDFVRRVKNRMPTASIQSSGIGIRSRRPGIGTVKPYPF